MGQEDNDYSPRRIGLMALGQKILSNLNWAGVWDNFRGGPRHWLQIVRYMRRSVKIDPEDAREELKTEPVFAGNEDPQLLGLTPFSGEVLVEGQMAAIYYCINLSSNRLNLVTQTGIGRVFPKHATPLEIVEAYLPKILSSRYLSICGPTAAGNDPSDGLIILKGGLSEGGRLSIRGYKGGIGIEQSLRVTLYSSAEVDRRQFEEDTVAVLGVPLSFEFERGRSLTDVELLKEAFRIARENDYEHSYNSEISFLLQNEQGNLFHCLIKSDHSILSDIEKQLLTKFPNLKGDDDFPSYTKKSQNIAYLIFCLLKAVNDEAGIIGERFRVVSLEEAVLSRIQATTQGKPDIRHIVAFVREF